MFKLYIVFDLGVVQFSDFLFGSHFELVLRGLRLHPVVRLYCELLKLRLQFGQFQQLVLQVFLLVLFMNVQSVVVHHWLVVYYCSLISKYT